MKYHLVMGQHAVPIQKKMFITGVDFHRVGEDHLVELTQYSLEVRSQADSIAPVW